ncbi:MAG TPA: hypothetical protein VG937_05430 [Polyangiaceae bacterium]|nr:hypothetical protein [Polyangiaceae bacterium]
MRAASLRRLLEGVLLAGAPLVFTDCLGQSSCPDNGVEPPRVESVAVEPTLGVLDSAQCSALCDEFHTGVITCVRESPESVLCLTHPFPCEGRRPVGLRSATRNVRSRFECHLGDAAWLEAASVDAFRVLRRELRAHGAPRRLLREASRSMRDERRHARATRALARRFGVPVARVERDDAPPRSLEAIALDNAVEGCVRETWGALIALHQAARATDASVRAVLGRIARDEVRHAALSMRIDRWLYPRLTAEQRARIRAARVAALAELAAEVRIALPKAERERLGLPSSGEAGSLLLELNRSLGLTVGA